MFGLWRSEKPSPSVDAAVVHLIQCRTQELALHALSKLLRTVATQVSAAGDQLKDLQRAMSQLAEQFATEATWPTDEPPTTSPTVLDEVRTTVTRELHKAMPDLVRQAGEKFQSQFLAPHGGLHSLCRKADTVGANADAVLRAVAHMEVATALTAIPIASAILGTDDSRDARLDRLKTCIDAARPRVQDCGGSQRLLAILPNGAIGSALEDALKQEWNPPATVASYADADVIFAFEAQDLPIPHVAARLIEDRTDFARTAGRLHTRTDVAWTDLAKVRLS
jgi:hypothetical protein